MKIVVGMSGGVDSAVVASLLKNQGHDVIGVFMRNWDSSVNNDTLGNPNINAQICPEEQDWNDAQKVAKQIGIPLKRIDFVEQYWDSVFLDLINQYQKGRTPNPDILCNKYIKFGAFYDWVFANIENVDYIATGHYAALINGQLSKPKDKWKDQTYFLAQVSKQKLAKVMFPLANLSKSQVRDYAKKNHLEVANKKDSTGICFIGERNFTAFLQNYIPAQPGKIVDITSNREVGTHVGAMYYTIGQRKGLNLGGMSEPYYVAGHDLNKKIIFVAPQSNQDYLSSNKAIIKEINWFDKNRDISQNLSVKLRYKSETIKCQIKWIDQTSAQISYDTFKAATPGQQAVFYQNQRCLGGGIIDQVFDQNGLKKYL